MMLVGSSDCMCLELIHYVVCNTSFNKPISDSEDMHPVCTWELAVAENCREVV